MPIRYLVVGASIDPTLKDLATKSLEEADVTVSDFIRSSLIYLVETGQVPFPIRRSVPGRPYKPRGKAVQPQQTPEAIAQQAVAEQA
jgi:antitoxin component of RelBE/YafQ-DinJ toxin-antitoxin module